MHIYFLCRLRVSTAMYWWCCRSTIIVAPTQVHWIKCYVLHFLIIFSDNILIMFTLNHIGMPNMIARNDANINRVWVHSDWIRIDSSLNSWSINTMTRKEHSLNILPGLFETTKTHRSTSLPIKWRKENFIQKIEIP